jgi:phosphoglycolate phosphatase-like HAD superfamily hydrolase
MEIKHKECFCPQFINHFDMQPVSKYAREAWEFVNLYSTTRGYNRFRAVERVLDLLGERDDVRARGVHPPSMNGLREWIKRETKLGNPALKKEVESTGDPDLERALEWSTDVNETIAKIVRNIPPFPGVRECLEKISAVADTAVVSQTPNEALEREWKEHGIDSYIRVICGQEYGTKTQHLAYTAKGKYAPERILMIGDAPGDMRAAKENGALFFPINPGSEEQSWNMLLDEGLERFFTGAYTGEYESGKIEEFNRCLPEKAPWKR